MPRRFPVLDDGPAPIYVSRAPAIERGLSQLLRGVQGGVDQYLKAKDIADTEAALRSPLIQQMIQNSLSGDVMGGARALLPTVEGQAQGANLGAVTMGPILGLENQPPNGLARASANGSLALADAPTTTPWYIDDHLADLSAGSKPGGGFDEVVTANPDNLYVPGMYDGLRVAGDMRSPSSTSFSEDMTVKGMPSQGPGPGIGPMSLKQYQLFQQMLPYYTQSNVARMQAGSAERRAADKTTSNAVVQQGKMAIELLKINESRLRDEQKRELALKKLKATGKGGNKLVEELRRAWQISVGEKHNTESIVSQMIASGADASESGSEARIAYDGMRAKVQEWTALENRQRAAYQEALNAYTGAIGAATQEQSKSTKPKGLGRPIQSIEDTANASDEELMRYWRATNK